MNLNFFSLISAFPIWVWFILAAILIVYVAIEVLSQPIGPEKLPYVKKKYLLTQSERKLFAILNESFSQQYYIFPQIHIASIINVKSGTREWQKYFNKIIRKSNDFTIFDKVNISPLLAIELDDITHDREDRIERDGFVDSAFNAAGIPIKHIKTVDLDNPEKIKIEILQILQVTNVSL